MIIEGLLSTLDKDGCPHVAPMGPVVNEALTEWTLRPFQTSTTYQLLRERGFGIFHVVDDVRPVVRRALGLNHVFQFDAHPDSGAIIRDACRWFRLEVTHWNTMNMRSEAIARVESQSELRPFWGWNRAKHAVLEAAILLTRRHILPIDSIATQIASLETAVEKTAGDAEWEAWRDVQAVLRESATISDNSVAP